MPPIYECDHVVLHHLDLIVTEVITEPFLRSIKGALLHFVVGALLCHQQIRALLHFVAILMICKLVIIVSVFAFIPIWTGLVVEEALGVMVIIDIGTAPERVPFDVRPPPILCIVPCHAVYPFGTSIVCVPFDAPLDLEPHEPFSNSHLPFLVLIAIAVGRWRWRWLLVALRVLWQLLMPMAMARRQ